MIETKKLFCRYCHVFCGIEVDVDTEKNRAVAIRGDREHPISSGYVCIKGRAELERIYHPDRLLSSKKRSNGILSDIDPEEALGEVADKLRNIVDKFGPNSVALYAGGASCRMSTCDPVFQSRWLDQLGSESYYTSFTIDAPSLCIAAYRLWGAFMPFSVSDMDHSEVSMLIGTNPLTSHLFTMPQPNALKRLRDNRKRGMKLIIINPRRCEVAEQADLFLQIKPGEDATLLSAMIKIIIDKGLYDKPYVEAFGSGLDALHKAVGDFDVEYAARRTQIPADMIREAAEMFATASSGAAVNGIGVTMGRHQNLTTQLVFTLNGLCGRYDRRGGMVHQPGVLTPAWPEGPADPIPLPLYPGPKSRIRGIRAITNWLGVTEMPTSCLTDEILTPGEGQIRALIVQSGNPALVLPDEKDTIRALKSLDLLVVNEMFESATAKCADYVFALKHPFEQTDIPHLMDTFSPFPFMQYTPPLVEAPGGVLDGYEVFWGLAKRLGMDLSSMGIPMDRKPTPDEMLDARFAGSRIPIDEIRKHPEGQIYGDRVQPVGHILPNMIGYPDKRMALGHPEVIEELKEVRAEPLIETGGYNEKENFAFRMITYHPKEAYCTQGQNLPSLHQRLPYNPVLMNPEDLKSLDIQDGDVVEVQTDFGSMEGIAGASDKLKTGVVAIAPFFGDPGDDRDFREKGSSVQRFIPDDYRYDPITGLALMTAVPVNVIALK